MLNRRSGALFSSSSTSYQVSGSPQAACNSRSSTGTTAACTRSRAAQAETSVSLITPP
jgi:hypothetical protein